MIYAVLDTDKEHQARGKIKIRERKKKHGTSRVNLHYLSFLVNASKKKKNLDGYTKTVKGMMFLLNQNPTSLSF